MKMLGLFVCLNLYHFKFDSNSFFLKHFLKAFECLFMGGAIFTISKRDLQLINFLILN